MNASRPQLYPDDPNQFYADMMIEVKFRLECVDRLVAQELKLPGFIAHEICCLQFRLICEVIALSALAAHGDDLNRSDLQTAYKADFILKQLEKLNPQYYPEPGRIVQNRGFRHFFPTKDSFPKADLIKLYRRSADFLHRGDRESVANRQKNSFPQLEIDEVKLITGRLMEQLAVHRIRLLDPKKELWVMMHSDNNGLPHVFTATRVL